MTFLLPPDIERLKKEGFKFQWSEAVAQRCYVIKVFLKMLRNSQDDACARASFLIKLQASETLTQVFFLWILQIFLRNLFYRTPLVAASEWSQHCITNSTKSIDLFRYTVRIGSRYVGNSFLTISASSKSMENTIRQMKINPT